MDLLGGRVSARLVYFTAEEKGRITSAGLGGAPARNQRVLDAYATVLVGPGRPFSAAQWAELYRAYTPPANAISSDFVSEGYEFRLTTNLRPGWRFVLNYSYTDSGRTNLANEMADWYGLRPAEGVLVRQGVNQDALGRYVAEPAAFAPGGTVSNALELASLGPAATAPVLTPSCSTI